MKILSLIASLWLALSAFGAIGSTAQWEIRSGGSANNGGFYTSGGTDYSQQTSPQYALTGVTTSGATDTLLTASASSDMIGNGARIVSGANFTAGFYQIIAVSAGVSIQLDRVCATAAGSAGVVNIGGALARLGDAGSAYVAGNRVWVRQATYTLTSTDTVSAAGTVALPIFIEGYATTRGDGYQGRNSVGELITANYPTLNYNATFQLNGSGANIVIECLTVTGNRSGNMLGSAYIRACRVVNSSVNTAAIGITSAIVIDNDVVLNGASGGATGAGIICNTGIAYGNRITTSGSSAPGIALQGGSRQAMAINNVIFNCGGPGITVAGTTTSPFIIGNTIRGGSSDGIDIVNASTVGGFIYNNIITDNAGWGIDFNGTSSGLLVGENRFRDNTSGNVNQGSPLYTYSNWFNITTDTGGPETDYVNAAGFDFSLIRLSPATSAGIPPGMSIGALQRDQTAASGGQKAFAY